MLRRTASVVAMVWLMAACGGDGASVTTTPGTSATTAASETAATATTQDQAPVGRWRDLLEIVPDGGDMATSIVINDYEVARALLGMAVLTDDASEDQIVEHLLALQLGPVAEDDPSQRRPPMGIVDDSFGVRAPYDVAAWRAAYGIGIIDVDRTVVAGIPPTQLIVWQGRIDPARVGEAVASDPEWSADLRTVQHDGATYYAWGDDPAMSDLERVGPVRPLGRGGCLHASDGLALRATACAVLEAALDAASGAGGSLGDLEPLALLADAVEGAGAYAAFLTLDVGVFAATSLAPSGSVPSGPGLVPYVAAATGAALAADTAVTIVALVHATAEDAAENAVRLERVVADGTSSALGRPWSELLGVLDITVDDVLVVARLETNGPGNFWYRLVALRDTLLAWE